MDSKDEVFVDDRRSDCDETKADSAVGHGNAADMHPAAVALGSGQRRASLEDDDPEGVQIAYDFDTFARVMSRHSRGTFILPDGGIREYHPEVWVGPERAVGLPDADRGGVVYLDLSRSAHVRTLAALELRLGGRYVFADRVLDVLSDGLHGAQGLSVLFDEIHRPIHSRRTKFSINVQLWAGMDWVTAVTVILRRSEQGTLSLAPVQGEMDRAARRAAEIAQQEVREALKKYGGGAIPVLMGEP